MFWTKPATNLLLSLYEEYEQEFENPRKKKKDVWREITEKLNEAGFDFSQLKVENKWRSLVQSHKDIKNNKKKTGEKRRTFPHFERLDNILSKRHDINPPFTSSSNPLATKENEKDKASTSSEEKVVTKSSSISAVRRREKRKEAENEGHINLTDFPPEVLEKICYNLEQFEEVNKLTLVCKKLKYFCYHRNTSFSVHLKNVNNLCGVYCMPNLRKLTVCGRSYFNSVIDADQVKSREFDAFVELFAMASLTRLQCLTLKNFRFQNTFLLFLIALSHLQLACLSFHRCSQISVGQLKCVLEEIPSLKYCDVECDVRSTEDMHIFAEIANQFVGQVNLNLNNLEEIPSVLLKYRRSKYRTPWPTGHLLIP
ncbi:uncharacterized protein LOC125672222 isoform X2 [Ostrea edulis]|uniref:uncharacterized protein LOC125672222 isoform X2 n=1 Tax=Ostrea edulis TaxID=37623 RepID=UPI0024AF64AC|nr:uncharacterized protein LOC125672222 isoform X2 [Ostrea edulis]